jgi:hypothetical protein
MLAAVAAATGARTLLQLLAGWKESVRGDDVGTTTDDGAALTQLLELVS